MQGLTLNIVVIDFSTLHHYGTVAIISIPNWYYIYMYLGLFKKCAYIFPI